jgi:hypothetical protein
VRFFDGLGVAEGGSFGMGKLKESFILFNKIKGVNLISHFTNYSS